VANIKAWFVGIAIWIFMSNVFIFLITYNYNSKIIIFLREGYLIFSVIIEVCLMLGLWYMYKQYLKNKKRRAKK
jgi:ABC-type transport system involved in multi-copper enzyme maturation permease subunit